MIGNGFPVVVAPPQHPIRPPIILEPGRQYNKPLWCCMVVSCIILWFAVSGSALSVLAIVGLYHPKPPQLHISDATLNAGYVGELTAPGGPSTSLALNADITMLAVISNNNTRIDILLQYMELDLYFKGHMIATQVVSPAPVRKEPGGSVLGYLRFITSEFELPRDDAEAWTNATVKGRPVMLRITGRFHTKLYIGPLLRFTYWVYPHCTLWLSPPPRGYLLKAICKV